MLRPIVRKPPKATKVYAKGTYGQVCKGICQKCHTLKMVTHVKVNDGIPQMWRAYCATCIEGINA